jgi:hypothetical protein
VIAAKSGADVPQAHWQYCREVAFDRTDDSLKALFLEAVRCAPRSRRTEDRP